MNWTWLLLSLACAPDDLLPEVPPPDQPYADCVESLWELGHERVFYFTYETGYDERGRTDWRVRYSLDEAKERWEWAWREDDQLADAWWEGLDTGADIHVHSAYDEHGQLQTEAFWEDGDTWLDSVRTTTWDARGNRIATDHLYEDSSYEVHELWEYDDLDRPIAYRWHNEGAGEDGDVVRVWAYTWDDEDHLLLEQRYRCSDGHVYEKWQNTWEGDLLVRREYYTPTTSGELDQRDDCAYTYDERGLLLVERCDQARKAMEWDLWGRPIDTTWGSQSNPHHRESRYYDCPWSTGGAVGEQ